MSNSRLLGGRRLSIVIPPLDQNEDDDDSYALQQAEALRLEKLIAEVSVVLILVQLSCLHQIGSLGE